jgi:hypothetical protein
MEDKVMRKTYILSSITRAIWGCHRASVDEPRLQGCCAVWLVNLFPKFRKKKTHNPEEKGGTFLPNVGK